ncbi:MAG: DUF6056 family protein [Eubacteriales bacterium]
MKFLKGKLIKLYKWHYFPFVIFAVGMSVIHAFMTMGFGDDSSFSIVLSDNNVTVISYIITRYNLWSSRVFIEATLVLLARLPLLWKILDTAVVVLSAVSISKLIPTVNARKTNWIITCILFIYPFQQMSSAGWIATTLNYYWPLAFGLFAMIPIRKILFNEKIRKYEYVFYSLALLYAANQEQMCAILLAVYPAFTIYLFLKKRLRSYMILQSLISVASLVFIFTCPGNFARKSQEIGNWFPQYDGISFIHKIEMGFSSSLFEFIMKPNFVFAVFCGTLFLCMLISHKDTKYRIIAAVPFVSCLIFGVFSESFGGLFPKIIAVKRSMTELGTVADWTSWRSWVPDILLLSICLCILFSLYNVFKNKNYSILSIFIILLGFGSHMIMAFSPTIWVSGERTYIFMYFSFMICTVFLYQMIIKFPFISEYTEAQTPD